MPRTKNDLPDVCPFSEEYDEVDEMIRDLATEKGLPYGINPDLVGGDPDYHAYWGSLPEDRERHKASVEWRVKLFWELKARPAWVAAWRAAKRMDERVEELCERRGLQFAPHECPPWWVRCDEELPPARTGFDHWEGTRRLAQRLRRELEAEIRAEDARKG
jgi:hypothetical protein